MQLELSLLGDKPFDVVGLGLNAVDELCVIPRYPEFNSKIRILSLHRQGGGQVATAMVALARWGLRARYIGKVGDDERGRYSLESIRKEGVDVTFVTVERGAFSQFAFILIDARNGERTILWDRDEKLMYRPGELDRKAVCSGRILHVDGHDIPATCQALQWAKEEGIPSVMDIDKVEEGTAEMIRMVDFLITSSTFPSRFTGIADPVEALKTLDREVPGFVAMTLGREGALAMTSAGPLHVPGFVVKAVDTTGAGDVFHAGFIFGLLQGWELRRILEFANAAAAIKCTQIGGRSGIPTLPRALAFLAERLPSWREPLQPG
jgi:sugar/nucleoside kinase (ribokinase family)